MVVTISLNVTATLVAGVQLLDVLEGCEELVVVPVGVVVAVTLVAAEELGV